MSKKEKTKINHDRRTNDWVRFVLSVAIVLVVVFLGSFVFTKFDLTQEKRYSLTDSTLDLLKSVEDPVFVRCYLQGEYPARFKRLEKAVRELLEEFHDYSNGNIDFEFVNPYASEDQKSTQLLENELMRSGLEPSRLAEYSQGAFENLLLWPGLIISRNDASIPLNLLKSEIAANSDEMVNNSLNNLEYELGSALKRLLDPNRPKIAFIEGHGELQPIEIYDTVRELGQFYSVSQVTIEGKIGALTTKLDGKKSRVVNYDAIIIAKPTERISDEDRWIIDQYAMNGGKVVWMIDALVAEMDSLRNEEQQFMATSRDLGIQDQLIEYGVRVNQDLLLDQASQEMVFGSGKLGDKEQQQLKSWFFHPLAFQISDVHPIAANLDPVLFRFASTLDTISTDARVKKTVVLKSTELSQSRRAPVRVNTNILFAPPDFKVLGKGPKSLAVMLEGEFISAYRDRIPAAIQKDEDIAYKEVSLPTKMMVIGDGDLIRNDHFINQDGEPRIVPLGMDQAVGAPLYDNKELFLNIMSYLLNDEALISMRSRSIALRMLDERAVEQQSIRIKVMNVALPLLLIVAFAIVTFLMRRRKYSIAKVKAESAS